MAFLVFAGVSTGAWGAEALKDEQRSGKHLISLKRLEAAIADKLEEVEKVTVLFVRPNVLLDFDMSIVASDGQNYRFFDCLLGSRGVVFACFNPEVELDEIPLDIKELAPAKKRFRVRK